MANILIQAFRNLKMRSQIISLDIFILLIVLSIAGIAIYVEIKIFYYISERSLQNTLVISDIKQISLTTHLMKHYIKEKHKTSILLADHISSFMHFYTKIQSEVVFTKPIDPCFSFDYYLNSIQVQKTQKMCYSIYENINLQDSFQKSPDVQLLYNGLRLLEDFGVEFNKFYPDFMQFVDIEDISFNALYPFGFYYTTLVKFYLNPRYVDHIQKTQKDPSQFYFFTDVYKMIVGDYNYYFSITQSLYNKDKKFIGILKMMLAIDDLNMQNTRSNIMLINKYGQVIYNEMENHEFNNSQVFYIYNETITGFNDSDWKLIEDQAIINIDTDFENESELTKCIILYNKLYQSNVHLRSEKFVKENFTLIIYTNITTKKNLEEKFDAAFLESETWILAAAGSMIFIGALSFSISICYINIICQPLIDINHNISNHVLSVGNNLNHQIFKILQPQKQSSNLYAKLNEQLWNLQDTIQIKQKKKCEQCILIEKMLYHKKDSSLNCKQIKNAISNIQGDTVLDSLELYQLFQFTLQQFKMYEQ
ncbi:unnamed protein product (macronuclear) [Paramecium tetraurelia]|uniref:Cache domain-containing protein n=1 Tax=Paramecium tetraurelia TaxID=5888 RepID=A0DDG4_PARTE|nr:uncharacterized protein GSPATT00015940001 [Paramecium tetraurelia]CAK81081.1 unnamed protein product [Paramecium tetraurelia]|eukprot:XP_001448478.1 hypothetical protein (macronuclear) [Paramecium tetraurelia strain d4-2]